MPSRKKITDGDSVAVVPTSAHQSAPLPSSKLPPLMRFPLYCTISLSIAALLHTFVADVTGYELRSVSRSANNSLLVPAILLSRAAELAVGWYGHYDDLDLVALTVLTHSPYLFLLFTFYGITLPTVLSTLGISILSIAIPTRLLRPRSALHNPRALSIPNRAIIADLPVLMVTTAFGASLYSLALWIALRVTSLPSFMAEHFDGLRSLEYAHSATLQGLFVAMLPLGYAAREFVLTPTLGAKAPKGQEDAPVPFLPATATFRETFEHNFVGERYRARVAVRRALVLAGLVFSSTVVQCSRSVDGVDFTGSVGYAAVWGAATLAMGIGFRWVGDV